LLVEDNDGIPHSSDTPWALELSRTLPNATYLSDKGAIGPKKKRRAPGEQEPNTTLRVDGG
jgi:hypothetical protein